MDSGRLGVIDLFSGAGGLTQGFVESGHYQPILAIDNDSWAIESYRRNFGEGHALCAPIESVDSFPLADVVVGGPPCQGFSLLGHNDQSNPLNSLWEHYHRALTDADPVVFVMENVPQLLRSEQYQRFKEAARARFQIKERVLTAADYGVPQTRKRAIVIGSSGPAPSRMFPTPSFFPNQKQASLRPWRDVRWAFRSIPAEPTFAREDVWDPEEGKAGRRLHVGRAPSDASLARYRAVPEGGNRWDLFRNRPDLTPDCWVRKTKGGTDLMGRLWWDRPSVTIRTEFFKPEKGRYLHPEADRPITHWEAARIQTFPDDFEFLGPKIQVARQIGNAVPCLMARAIADQIATVLTETEPPSESYRSNLRRRNS